MAVKQRKVRARPPNPSSPSSSSQQSNDMPSTALPSFLRGQPLWIILAVSSGTCAALNGVFAKLTTTSLTSTLSTSLQHLLSLPDTYATPIDIAVRGFFFLMNLAFNALMWALFTAALTRGDSTTRVSVVNVSSNFMVTAVLGWVIFGEKLPPLWWAGAALLAVGNVVIGRRVEDGGKGKTEAVGEGDGGVEAEGLLRSQDEQEREGDLLELDEDVGDEGRRLRKGEDVDAPL